MATRTVVIEQLGADGVTFDGPAVTVVIERGLKGDTGPNTITTTTTTDLSGLLAGDGSTVGRVSLDSPIGLYQKTVAALESVPIFTRTPIPFTLVSLDAASAATGTVNVGIFKNGVSVSDFDVDSPTAFDFAINVAFAAGDRFDVRTQPGFGTATGFAGTLVFRRIVE